MVTEIKLLPGQASLLTDFESPILAAIAGCVAGDTLIDTSDGVKPIASMLGFNRVLALTDRGIECVPAFIFRKGEAQLYRLTLVSGESIEATADHYLLVSDERTLRCCSVAELLTTLSGKVSVVGVEPSGVALSPPLECLPYLQFLLYHRLNRITSIEPTTIASYYDMVVPYYHNYLAQGMVHHNTGAGKTMLGYWWLHSRMETYPGNTWLLAEPTYNMLSKIILESSDPERPTLEQYFRMVGHHPDYHAVDKILYTDHGKVYLASADRPDSMQGAAVKGCWLDEAGQMALLAHETASQRCSMLSGQELLTTTPYNLGWLLSLKNMGVGRGIHVETWRSIDRPGFPKESYERAKQILPSWRFRMLYDAEFERPAGVIYHMFDESVCLTDRFTIPSQWLVYVGHDFGPDNPAALFYAQDPTTGQFYLFDEYIPGAGVSVNKRVEAFKEKTKGYNVVKRVGGSHTEEENRQAYNAHGWVISEPKINHVEPQIDKVIGMHQLNKIMVFRDMEHYLDEKRTFSRELDAENQPTAKIKDESRYHLMSCLVAGTQIKTIAGDKPIEDIRAGDLVATRQGYQPVIASGLTQADAEVFEVSFSDGSKLVGTTEHPIFIKGKGFVSLTCVRYNDIIEVWKEKQLSTMEQNITDTRKQNGALTECILGQGRDFSTELCGKMPMGRYLLGIPSTIKTKTHLIMNYLTLNVRAMAYICQGIWRGTSMILNTLPEFVLLPESVINYGLRQMKGEPTLPRDYGGIGNLFSKSVFTVGRNTQRLSHRIANSVYQSVKQHIDVRCLGVKSSGRASVYNLSVGNVPEYYANGILVHNCERYLISDFTPETAVSNKPVSKHLY